MPKIFNKNDIANIESPEILDLIYQANRLTDADGYEIYDTNSESLIRILEKALMLAKQKQEWPAYFIVIYELFYMLQRENEYIKLIKYAEIFYHDSELYMDRAAAVCRDLKLGDYCIWSYNMIYQAYQKYPQITDEKLDEFFEKYNAVCTKYGSKINYYSDLLKLALLYGDKEMAAENKKLFEQYEIKSCYLCKMKTVIGYYLLCEDYESADHMIEQIRTRSIPKKHMWCYNHCYLAEEKELISAVLNYCLLFGRSTYFHKLLEANKDLFEFKKEEDCAMNDICYYICCQNWSLIDEDIKAAKDDILDWKKNKQSFLGYIYDCLSWHCYFTLLGKHIKEDDTVIQDIEDVLADLAKEIGIEDENAESLISSISEFFEKEADKLGAQMSASRKKFDYEALKQSWHECMGIN